MFKQSFDDSQKQKKTINQQILLFHFGLISFINIDFSMVFRSL